MPRPKNKSELVERSQTNFDDLLQFISSLSISDQNRVFPKGYLNRNIRDVIAHLYHWHLMFENWYKIGMKGEKPEMPAPGYSWKMTPELNREIQKEYRQISLDDAVDLFKKSHKRIHKIIAKHSNKELFEKKRYGWTGSTSVGSYLVSTTSSHYDWAIKLIKKCLSGKKK